MRCDIADDHRYTEHMFMHAFHHHPTTLDEAQQAWLARWIHRIPEEAWEEQWSAGAMHHRLAFGWRYESGALDAAPPIPPPLMRLRRHLARALAVHLDEHEHAVLSRYPAGAGAQPHHAPAFSGPLVGVCLQGSMQWSRGGRPPRTVEVQPGDAYVLTGEGGTLLPTEETRWAVRYRAVRRPR